MIFIKINPKDSEETCLSDTMLFKNATLSDLGADPILHGEKAGDKPPGDSTASSYLESVKNFSYVIHYLLRLELFIICTK
jgi:hypothetical protein